MFRFLLTEFTRRRGGIIGWGIGLGIAALLMALMFPQIEEQFALLDLSEIPLYQALGIDDSITTLPGFLATYLSTLFIPLLCAYAIIIGTGILAGEEDDGSLEMTLTLPLRRWQIVVSKALVIAIALLATGLMVGVGYALGVLLIGGNDSMNALDALGAGLNLWPITMVVAMFSLLAGAYLPSRRPAWLLATIVLIIMYMLDNLGNVIESAEPLAVISPFTYYNNGLTETVYADANITLFVIAGVCLLLAILAFQRRNITVGAWPWQRAKLPQA